ncbi:MAG: riboflavin biosynthesis protein RibF [Oscillospiraceae bacterium]|nr:riboflavin biosynthesis protein RibF [Oscillospiraceae bacterium]
MITHHSFDADSPKAGTAVALGFFDGMHVGHMQVIQKALDLKKDGLESCVFSFDTSHVSPNAEKGSKQIMSLSEKIAFCEKIGVDHLYIPDFARIRDISHESFIAEILQEKLRAKVVCSGSDFRYGKNARGNTETLARECAGLGIGLHVLPPVKYNGLPVSATRIRAALEEGDVALAGRLLGRSYSYALPVSEGRKLGRELGFPTMNQIFEPSRLLPRFGVYASLTELNGELMASVTNVGVKPTIGAAGAALSETYIIGMNRELYGRTITVRLAAYLRPEVVFYSLEALKTQIREDARCAQELLLKL